MDTQKIPPSPRALGLIDMTEICQLLAMSRPTLDKIADDPRRHFPKRVRLGKRTFVNEQHLRRWIDAALSNEEAA
jgi:predicted DNA-binding transcriptional regulator AlpA